MKIYHIAQESYLSVGHNLSPFALWQYGEGKFQATDIITPPPDVKNWHEVLNHSTWNREITGTVFSGRYQEDTNTVSVSGYSKDGEVPAFLERKLRSRFGQDITIKNFVQIKSYDHSYAFIGDKMKIYRVSEIELNSPEANKNTDLSEYEHLMSIPFEDLIKQYDLVMCQEMLDSVQFDINNSKAGPNLMTRIRCQQDGSDPAIIHEEKMKKLYKNLRAVQDRICLLKGIKT